MIHKTKQIKLFFLSALCAIGLWSCFGSSNYRNSFTDIYIRFENVDCDSKGEDFIFRMQNISVPDQNELFDIIPLNETKGISVKIKKGENLHLKIWNLKNKLLVDEIIKINETVYLGDPMTRELKFCVAGTLVKNYF